MVAATQFAGLMQRLPSEEGIDLVVAGAVVFKNMFAMGKKSRPPIVPIVSKSQN